MSYSLIWDTAVLALFLQLMTAAGLVLGQACTTEVANESSALAQGLHHRCLRPAAALQSVRRRRTAAVRPAGDLRQHRRTAGDSRFGCRPVLLGSATQHAEASARLFPARQ